MFAALPLPHQVREAADVKLDPKGLLELCHLGFSAVKPNEHLKRGAFLQSYFSTLQWFVVILIILGESL